MSEGWNHSIHYHGLLLDQVPRPCRRALDVGCGVGTFARRLATVADRVDAIDREAEVVARAQQQSPGTSNLRFTAADFLAWPESDTYDFVSMIATLHHLPFERALAHAVHVLRPGGVLAVLGLCRNRSLLDLAPAALAFPVSWYHRMTQPTCRVDAPILDPTMTLEEIRRGAEKVIPGAIVRRHLLWRYTMIWVKPGSSIAG